MKKTLLLLTFAALIAGNSFGQGSKDYGSGLKINLNESGSKYVRFIIWNQMWFRSGQQNPGTTVNGEITKTATDFGIRRARVLAYAQISPRYMILTHFGINNQTFVNGGGSGTTGTGGYGAGKKPQIFMHDVWNEYTLVPAVSFKDKDKKNKGTLAVGGGLHYWHGISRMSSASTLNFLTIDSPIFTWANIELSDQFARQMGFYAKGSISKFAYRASINKPFSTSLAPPTTGAAVSNNTNSHNWSKSGYFEYNFLDKESDFLPFKVGTYLGTKKVFNVGAGFYNEKKGSQSTAGKHDVNLISLDAFLDMPVGAKDKNMAVTAYAGYFNYNFGPNYLRYVGIMNEGAAISGQTLANGPGNNRAMIGTGDILYAQAGLLLPKSKTGNTRVQLFGAATNKKFDALEDAATEFDFGANILMDGHHAKITPQYSTRTIFNANGTKNGSKGEFILQLQVYL